MTLTKEQIDSIAKSVFSAIYEKLITKEKYNLKKLIKLYTTAETGEKYALSVNEFAAIAIIVRRKIRSNRTKNSIAKALAPLLCPSTNYRAGDEEYAKSKM
jgi:hypothetical protein